MSERPGVNSAQIDEKDLRRVFGCFPSGVTAVCSLDGAQPIGIAASSFTSVSINPPLVSVCISNTSTTWPRLRERPRLGLSVLAHDQESACRALAAKEQDRFVGLSWRMGQSASVLIDGAVAWLECSIHAELEAGDHSVVLLRIHDLGADHGAEPLIFHGSRFRELARLTPEA